MKSVREKRRVSGADIEDEKYALSLEVVKGAPTSTFINGISLDHGEGMCSVELEHYLDA